MDALVDLKYTRAYFILVGEFDFRVSRIDQGFSRRNISCEGRFLYEQASPPLGGSPPLNTTNIGLIFCPLIMPGSLRNYWLMNLTWSFPD
jgi:hypothetical protein